MSTDRWRYLVVSVKSGFFGRIGAALQAELDRQGAAGWELVSVVRAHQFGPADLVFKRKA
jgi:hypothetical protein